MKSTVKIRFALILGLAVGSVLSLGRPTFAEEEVEAAAKSNLASISLPQNTQRILEGSIPEEITSTLKELMKQAGPKVKQGRNEVLAWQGRSYKKSSASLIIKQVAASLQAAGWSYETQEGNDGVTLVTAIRKVPVRKGLIGVWAVSDDALLLAWTEMLPANAAAPKIEDTPEEEPADTPAEKPVAPPVKTPVTGSRPSAAPAGAIVINADAGTRVVNVMKNSMPKIPAFTKLTPKKGYVRGFVKDSHGKPLAGAHLGVRSTAVGGAYSGAQGKTDARGYYEIQVPFGVAHFYNAGYTVSYGEGRAALGLHPADGELDSFASNVGGVENFVLLPYGIADPDEVQDNPNYSGNYYGGGFSFYLHGGEGNWEIPGGSLVEITLTPKSRVIDGSQAKTIIIRKKMPEGSSILYTNNIPIATYRISVKVAGQSTVKIKETGPYSSRPFGISPKEGEDAVDLQFRPFSAKAESPVAGRGAWEQLTVDIYR